MDRDWPFFAALLSNAEMALAKADLTIGERYAELVEDETLREAIWAPIRAEYERTRELVLAVTGQARLLDRTPVLQRSIERRNPYVDPLSFIQVELLRRLRRDGASEDLVRAMLLTINGIAGGLRNTGLNPIPAGWGRGPIPRRPALGHGVDQASRRKSRRLVLSFQFERSHRAHRQGREQADRRSPHRRRRLDDRLHSELETLTTTARRELAARRDARAAGSNPAEKATSSTRSTRARSSSNGRPAAVAPGGEQGVAGRPPLATASQRSARAWDSHSRRRGAAITSGGRRGEADPRARASRSPRPR